MYLVHQVFLAILDLQGILANLVLQVTLVLLESQVHQESQDTQGYQVQAVHPGSLAIQAPRAYQVHQV